MLAPVYVVDVPRGKQFLFLLPLAIVATPIALFQISGSVILNIAPADRDFDFSNVSSKKIISWDFRPKAVIGNAMDDGAGGVWHFPFVEKAVTIGGAGQFMQFGNWTTLGLMDLGEIYPASGKPKIILPANIAIVGNAFAEQSFIFNQPKAPTVVNSTGGVFFKCNVYFN